MLKTQHMMVKNVVTAKEDISVRKAIGILFKRHVGAIIVTDDKRKCRGIFTERDAIRVVAQDIPLDKTTLGRVMTKNPITVSQNTTFEESRRLLISHEIRHLPVVDSHGKLVGLLVARHFLDELSGMKS
jgi:CBS domain-containing protein